jgi:hypothetical protein
MAGGAAGAAAAAAAAAAAKRARDQEEEEMTSYEPVDMSDGWEFKILRSMRADFRYQERLQQALNEEGRAGWVLVEKFDDSRIRLKRPATARRNDVALGFDPYRAYYGRSEAQHNMVILTVVLAVTGAILLTGLLIAALHN